MPDLTPRPTVFNGVRMRSRLEAGFAQWLDSEGVPWEYEPQAFSSGEGQYLPDFRIRVRVLWDDDHYDHAYVEVKPFLPIDVDALAERMSIIRESEPGVPLLLAYKDPTPSLIGIPPTRRKWWPAHWTMTLHDVGVAFDQQHGPWPDGYWKGPEV